MTNADGSYRGIIDSNVKRNLESNGIRYAVLDSEGGLVDWCLGYNLDQVIARAIGTTGLYYDAAKGLVFQATPVVTRSREDRAIEILNEMINNSEIRATMTTEQVHEICEIVLDQKI